jgi:hypothetical protein
MKKTKPVQHYLYIKETGGCDYTIGCGQTLVPLPDNWTDQDVVNAFNDFGLDGQDHDVEAALVVTLDRDVMDLYRQKCEVLRQADEWDSRARKMADLARLKKELGVP